MKAETPETSAVRVQLGETLRTARESRGWSQQDVASQLNLTRQLVGLLDAGDVAELPPTFARGYLRAYAKLLGLDPQQIVGEFDRCIPADTAARSVQQLGRIDQPVHISQRTLQLFSVLLVLVLLAAGFYWWQQHNPERIERSAILEHVEVESADGTTQLHPLTEPEDAAVVEGQGPAPQPPEDLSAELSEPAEAEEPAALQAPVEPSTAVPQPATAAPAVQAAPAAAAEQAALAPGNVPALIPAPSVAAPQAPSSVPTVPEPVAPPPTAPTAPTAATPEPAPAPGVGVGVGEGVLEIVFSETCWVQVTDGHGKILHSALNRKGERLQLTGQTPLKLHLGFASAAQVRFNGQAVDVASYARGETARLILGQ